MLLTAGCSARQATDELEEPAGGGVPRWGARIRALEAYLALHHEIVVVDPLDRVQQVGASAVCWSVLRAVLMLRVHI